MKPVTHIPLRHHARALFTIVGGAVLVNPAFAREPNDDQALEEIVVTGFRASLQAAMEIKRDAVGIVDAVSSDDIGKMPDTNLGEALQRITGVSIDRRNGEGAVVTVRGFGPDFNLVMLNGRQMPTADGFAGGGAITAGAIASNTRSFNFANLAAEGVRALEVHKTGRADASPGGIGATINIRTLRPFDNQGVVTNLSAKALIDGNVENGDEVTPELSGFFSYANDARSWGVSLSANYQRRASSASGADVNGWLIQPWLGAPGDLAANQAIAPLHVNNNSTPGDPSDDFVDATIVNAPRDGQLYGIPQDVRYSFADRSSERLNGQVAVQFAPLDSLTLTADYTYASTELVEDRSEQTVWLQRSGFTTLEFDTNEAVATPLVLKEFAGAGKDFAFGQFHREQKYDTRSLGFNADWRATEHLSFTLDVHDSDAHSVPNDQLTGGAQTEFSMAGKLATTGDCAPPATCTNFWGQELQFAPALPLAIRTLYPTNTAAFASVNGDSDYTFDATSLGSQVMNILYQEQQTGVRQGQISASLQHDDLDMKFGVDVRALETHFRVSQGSMALGDWGIADVGQVPGMVALLEPFSVVGAFDDFSAVGAASTGWRGNADTLGQWALTPTAEGGGGYGNWAQPSAPDGELRRNPQYVFEQRVAEDVAAAFAEITLHGTMFERPVNLNIGVRYEDTEVTATTQIRVPEAILWQDGNAFTIERTDQLQGYSEKADYDHWLPNLDFDIDLTTNIKARASASKTIARAGYGKLVAGPMIDAPTGSTLNGARAGANAANPGLLPLESDNIDLSLEWYFADNAYLSAAYWQKHVSDFPSVAKGQESLYDLRDQTSGPRAQAAQAELQRRGLPSDDRSLFTMVAMTENPAGFTDGAGQFWAGGAAAYTGTAAQQAAFAAQFDVLPRADDPLYQFDAARLVNGKSAKLDGWEFAGQYFFGTSGFGLQANYTLVTGDIHFEDSEDPGVIQFALPGLSDSANLIVMYEKYGVTARLAFNWRDEFLQNSSYDFFNNPIYVEAYEQLDASVAYAINERFSVAFEGINVLGSDVRWHGRSERQLWFLEDQGARYSIGVRYKL